MTGMPSLTTFTQHNSGSPSHNTQTRKRNKNSPNWKGRSKTVTVCTWHDTIENSKDATKKLLEFISEFGTVAWYKINKQKSVAFLYTKNKLSERKIKETVLFIIA